MAEREDSVGAPAVGGGRGLSSAGGAAAAGANGGAAEAAMFKALTEHSLEFIGMCDLELRPFYVNEEGRKMVGLGSLEEACAVRVPDFFFPEDQRFITEEFFPKVLREGAGEVELRFRHFQTGAALWIIYNVFLVRDAQGRVSGYATVSRDITERKRREEALRKNNETFHKLIENSPMGIFVVDADFRLRNASLGAQRAFANVPAPLIGRDLGECLRTTWPEPFASETIGRFRHTLETGEPYVARDTVEQRRDSGAVEAYDWRIERVTLPDGRYGVVCYYYELTERRRLEQQLRESEEKYRVLFESIDQGFCTIEVLFDEGQEAVDLRFLMVNPAFEKQTGLLNAAGRRVREIVPRLEKHWFQVYGRIALTGEPQRFENVAKELHRCYEVYAWRVGEPAQRRVAILFNDISERKRAEEERERLLREVERERARLQAVLEALPVGVWVADASGKMVLVNQAAAAIFGGRAPAVEEISDYGVYQVWYPGTGEPVPVEDYPLVRALRGEVVRDMVLERELADHSRGTHLASANPIRDAAGNIVGGVVIAMDTTARTRAEERLAESEERYRLLFENMNEGFALAEMIWDEQGQPVDWRYLEVNERWAQTGVGVRETVGRTAREVNPEIEPYWLETYGRVVKTGQAVAYENYAAGFGKWFATFAFKHSENRFGLLFLDITDRKRADEALRESEERLRLALEGARAGVWEVRLDSGAVYWSAEYRELYGFGAEVPPSDEAWVSRVHPEDLGRIRENVRRELARESGRGWTQAFRIQHPTRGLRWIESLVRVRRDAAGRAVSFGGINLDVTERKEAEAVLARSKEELEQLVAERTEKLQELVGELEHFSYTITHDLKSPLRAMRGFAEMASLMWEAGQTKKAKESLDKIALAAERMDRLIADALNYSRSVRQELPVEDVDAGALLRGMLDSYPEFQPARAHIRVEGRLPVVLANEAGLTQVFSNLLGNAVKFVKPGERPDIRVWAEVLADGHQGKSEIGKMNSESGWVRIWVEDKGIGISEAMQPRLFDLFARGSKEYEGTGVGLALVRKVVQRMGGKVGVESEEGKGSRFWLELKCGEARESGGQVSLSARTEEASGAVLYVEDEESDAMFMEVAFEEKGLEGRLRVVRDGRRAIDYLSGAGSYGDREKYPVPSVVLLDLNLPQVSGFEVLKWMRNNPDYARTPVVVFSSSTREDDRVKARELGADEFVAKPSSGMKFGEVVERLQEKWLGAGAEKVKDKG